MDPLELKLMEFCRDLKLEVGNMLPEKPFRFGFYADLNPKEQGDLQGTADRLVAQGYLCERESKMSGSDLALGQAGFDFIYSAQFERLLKGDPPVTSQTFNFNGTGHNIQIGNNNSQQIISAIQLLTEEINKADVPEEAKAEAKSMLVALMNNPLVSGLLSGVGATALGKLLGM